MRHLGFSLACLERINEAYPFLGVYVKLTKVTRNKISFKIPEKIYLIFNIDKLRSQFIFKKRIILTDL